MHKSPPTPSDRAIDFKVAPVLVPHSMRGAQRWAPCHNSPVFPGFWRHHRGKAMAFSGLGAVLLGFGSTRSWASKPVRTGTPPAANLLCQPRTSHLDVFPTAAVLSFLASLGGSCPAQHPWCSFCPRLSLPVAWGASAGRTGHGARSGASSRYECTSGTGVMGVTSVHLQRSVPNTCIPATLFPPQRVMGASGPRNELLLV